MANWLTRDPHNNSSYLQWCSKPREECNADGIYWDGGGYVDEHCPSLFERFTTKESHLKPGEIARIKSIRFELDRR